VISNRDDFGQVLPFILLTTTLIITVVKSSLALSLGLVGALSIIRFRTPVKEPEELAYLFIAIAIGLGLGANQTLPTVIASVFILATIAVTQKFRSNRRQSSLYLAIDVPAGEVLEQPLLTQMTEIVSRYATTCDLHRLQRSNESTQITYFIDVVDVEGVSRLTSEIDSFLPGSEVTIIDQRRIPGV
tara:strand:+ start:223 stop:783 length:561 start_codon:yes stop_codon:yes gene_type:complete